MSKKFLIIPWSVLSIVNDAKEKMTFSSFPWVIRTFLKHFKKRVFIICDEISWGKGTNHVIEDKWKKNARGEWQRVEATSEMSIRARMLQLFAHHSAARCGLSGTLVTKSPVNLINPYRFLSDSIFSNQDYVIIGDEHMIQMNLRTVRNKRVPITVKVWDEVRKRMINAYRLGGDTQLLYTIHSIRSEYGFTPDECEHILTNHKYAPFRNMAKLLKRVEDITITVNREDIFDTSFDEKVYNPFVRTYTIGKEGLQIAKEFIRLGFTDNYELGKAAAAELQHRLLDICNGFEPVFSDTEFTVVTDQYCNKQTKPKVAYRTLKEQPKLELLGELLQEINLEENQVLIGCSRTNAFGSITEYLKKEGVSYVGFSGSSSDEEKAEAERKIISGEARVFVGNPAAMAFGLNSLAKINYIIVYCFDLSVERYVQFIHRIMRGQSKTYKFSYFLCAKGSIEERNYKALTSGVDLLSESNTRELFEFEE